jgi:hypothetical protein
MGNPNTSGLPPYQEQKTKKLVSKSIADSMKVLKEKNKKEQDKLKKK